MRTVSLDQFELEVYRALFSLDKEPSLMPEKFTVCLQYKYEYFPADLGTDMIFISFENTLYGDSVVEAFEKNLTYWEVVRNEWPDRQKIMHHIWSFQSLFTGIH